MLNFEKFLFYLIQLSIFSCCVIYWFWLSYV